MYNVKYDYRFIIASFFYENLRCRKIKKIFKVCVVNVID